MKDSPQSLSLAREADVVPLNEGLDKIVETHKLFPADIVAPARELEMTLMMFSPTEIASLLVLAVRRLAAS